MDVIYHSEDYDIFQTVSFSLPMVFMGKETKVMLDSLSVSWEMMS